MLLVLYNFSNVSLHLSLTQTKPGIIIIAQSFKCFHVFFWYLIISYKPFNTGFWHPCDLSVINS